MRAYQVTLTTQNTNYHLLALVRAIDSAFADIGGPVIQADPDGGAEVFLLGDSTLDATHYGQKLVAGNTTPRLNQLSGVWARCDTAGKKLNILVIR